MKNVAFLVSGGGTNMQSVLDAIDAGVINARAVCVISSREGAYALNRAKKHGIPTYVVPSRTMTQEDRDRLIMEILDGCCTDFVVLAGYLSILSPAFVAHYPRRIINIHPALLPAYGGEGMYGIRVHEAVIAAGEKFSGATVHYVDNGTDTGEIIAQRSLPVLPDDTPETLQERILDQIEHKILPDVLARLCREDKRIRSNQMKKRALVSVSNKDGVVDFAKGLERLGYEVVSTGGTARALKEAGVHVTGISEITGFPECLDGRVKTLHPVVHAGLLALRDNPDHMAQLEKLGINTIDVVAVNLYPFKETIEKPGCTLSDAIENIDIGGPTMLRSAAKNARSVLVVCDPTDYSEALERLEKKTDDQKFRMKLMRKVYKHTSEYDTRIAGYLAEQLEK